LLTGVIAVASEEVDAGRIAGIAREQPLYLLTRILATAVDEEPVGALGDGETTERHQQGRDDGGRIHPAPRPDLRDVLEHDKADDRSDQCADRLKAECREHQLAPRARRDALGDDEVGGRIVAPEREPEAEQEEDEQVIARARDQQREEDHEDDHLDDEHHLAAIPVREAAEGDGADQDAEQARRTHHPVLKAAEVEFLGDQRHRDAGHEDDEALEELARGGERPDPPLHGGHRRPRHRRAVRPDGGLVNISLDRPRRRRRFLEIGRVDVHGGSLRVGMNRATTAVAVSAPWQ
jgi:hypothetical protein